MKRLNLNQLETFTRVVETGSFSAAAEKLGLTQPAVSLQIRELEKKLGAALIERVGKKARPTGAGLELLVHADRIDAAVAAALESVARHATDTVGPVHLGTDTTVSIYLLPPVLSALRKRYPNLEITVTTGNAAGIVKAVEENRIDLALATLPVSGRAFEVTPVVDDAFVAIAPKDMALPKKLPLPKLRPTMPARNRPRADSWLKANPSRSRPSPARMA